MVAVGKDVHAFADNFAFRLLFIADQDAAHLGIGRGQGGGCGGEIEGSLHEANVIEVVGIGRPALRMLSMT